MTDQEKNLFMENFAGYLRQIKNIEPTFTKRGLVNFTHKGRYFQLSHRGWFRSYGSHGWYIVFKNGKIKETDDGYRLDNRYAARFKDSVELISRIEKSGILN